MEAILISIVASGLRAAAYFVGSTVARYISYVLAPTRWHPDSHSLIIVLGLKRNYPEALAWRSRSRICSPPESDSSSCDIELRDGFVDVAVGRRTPAQQAYIRIADLQFFLAPLVLGATLCSE